MAIPKDPAFRFEVPEHGPQRSRTPFPQPLIDADGEVIQFHSLPVMWDDSGIFLRLNDARVDPGAWILIGKAGPRLATPKQVAQLLK